MALPRDHLHFVTGRTPFLWPGCAAHPQNPRFNLSARPPPSHPLFPKTPCLVFKPASRRLHPSSSRPRFDRTKLGLVLKDMVSCVRMSMAQAFPYVSPSRASPQFWRPSGRIGGKGPLGPRRRGAERSGLRSARAAANRRPCSHVAPRLLPTKVSLRCRPSSGVSSAICSASCNANQCYHAFVALHSISITVSGPSTSLRADEFGSGLCFWPDSTSKVASMGGDWGSSRCACVLA